MRYRERRMLEINKKNQDHKIKNTVVEKKKEDIELRIPVYIDGKTVVQVLEKNMSNYVKYFNSTQEMNEIIEKFRKIALTP